MSETNPIPFRAETRQLLDILAHSLYKEREIFLRELISNASDALTRLDFEMLTNRDVLDPDAALSIRVIPDPKENTLTVVDTGIGMTAAELVENLGTIAHSGAKAFVEASKSQAAQSGGRSLVDVIGQFGVGFYSTFMVAEWIRVVSHSFQPDVQAAAWYSTGDDTFTVEPAERPQRGTAVIVKLKDDAKEFLEEYRLREIIRKHSDFIPYPIYLGDSDEQVNRQTALWRQNPREVEKKDYDEFYKQLTLDLEAPLTYAHMSVDAPVQMYAVLFVPARAERGLFSLRKEDGLRLYARKVLIQDYCKELLPEYFRFVQGVVDSEDLPLNVSRETVQANKMMINLKKLVSGKVIDTLKKLAADAPESYATFWREFGRYLKEGVAVEPVEPEALYPLLRFHTLAQSEAWSSLDDYIGRMKPDQKEIYYILGDDDRSLIHSPHLDVVRQYDYDVLLLTDPIDAFMLVRLTKYQDKPLTNVAAADLKPTAQPKGADVGETAAAVPEGSLLTLIERFRTQLGERVTDVRATDRLVDSPARLVDPEGAPKQEFQRVYRLLKEDFVAPKKVLEINPRHPILLGLDALPADNPLATLVIEQLYEDALLIEGLHPDPAGMIGRLQQLMQAALQHDRTGW
jgi:molecular chaperone HtpG